MRFFVKASTSTWPWWDEVGYEYYGNLGKSHYPVLDLGRIRSGTSTMEILVKGNTQYLSLVG